MENIDGTKASRRTLPLFEAYLVERETEIQNRKIRCAARGFDFWTLVRDMWSPFREDQDQDALHCNMQYLPRPEVFVLRMMLVILAALVIFAIYVGLSKIWTAWTITSAPKVTADFQPSRKDLFKAWVRDLTIAKWIERFTATSSHVSQKEETKHLSEKSSADVIDNIEQQLYSHSEKMTEHITAYKKFCQEKKDLIIRKSLESRQQELAAVDQEFAETLKRINAKWNTSNESMADKLSTTIGMSKTTEFTAFDHAFDASLEKLKDDIQAALNALPDILGKAVTQALLEHPLK